MRKKLFWVILILVVFFVFFRCFIFKNKFEYFDKIFINVFKYKESMLYEEQEKSDDTQIISIKPTSNIYYSNALTFAIEGNTDEKNINIKYELNNEIYDLNMETDNILVDSEGKKCIKFYVYQDENLINEYDYTVYVVFPYKHQFAEKNRVNGIGVHYYGNEDYNKDKLLLGSLGLNSIRTDFSYSIIKRNQFKNYDNWVYDFKDSSISIWALLDGTSLIDSDEKVNEFVSFYNLICNKYNFITEFEIMNEVNITNKPAYLDEDSIVYYNDIFRKLFSEKRRISVGGTATGFSAGNWITSEQFYKNINSDNGFNVINNVAFHPYAINNLNILRNKIESHINLFNTYGGFNKINITEYGSTMAAVNESLQAIDDVKQSIVIDQYTDTKFLYNLWSTSSDLKNWSGQFGILDNDYCPKLSYYAMKNYYQNINGSEYIGWIAEDSDGLEKNIFDKDGVPLIVCWTADSSKTIEIPYSGFTAYDLYGNEIENTTGKLTVNSSPVYLKNADRSYFYRAISNTAASAYDEFLTNYSDYLDSSDEMIVVKNEVNKMKKYAEGLANGGEVSEAEALSKMKEHFAIGDMILKAYKDEKLSCEYVKLSSMLDQLNTIGYAFEDLVTITAKDVSNANLTVTEKIMNTFDNKASANSDVEMVYPNKIKAFAKDYYDTSSYINGLEEDNPIKNGLIISKGLHAYYLAGWADSFADCYLETPEIAIQYSNTELTNEDVVVTLESNVPIEMEGSNQYTFTENGSFTFKYILYGEPKEITAVVDWIDKDAPAISGIDEREDETEQVTLNVTDANLDTITVTKDGQDVSFSNGDILIEKGEYEVVAKDRAGNSSERPFKIVDYIESNKIYYVSPDGTGDGSSEDLPMSAKDLNKLKLYAGDKILLKSGEKYSVNIECKRKGSPDNRVVISNYGEGALPVINGSLDLVSNLKISNLRFTNNAESCLVTNYDYCENVKIENCIFDNVADSAIYLNRQVSNFEITNCIFKNCKNAGITMKNDSQNLMVNSVKITNNIFVNLTKSIDIASEVADNTFENVEIGENYFIVQTSDEAVIKVGKIVTDKFDVSVYSNLFYSFSRAYEVFEDSLNDIKGHLLCDYNTFYAYKESKYLNDISDIKTLGDEYGNEANSNVTVIDREKYDVYDCLNTTLKLDDKEQILSNLTEKIDVGNRRMQVDVVGSPDKIIKNKVMGLEEMKTSDIEEITDSSVADEVLPLAGWQKVSIAIISIIVITGLFSAGKYSKYKKDTKKQIRRK